MRWDRLAASLVAGQGVRFPRPRGSYVSVCLDAQMAMVYLCRTVDHVDMSHPLATFDPDDIRDSTADVGLPGWAKTLVERVREAAASGQTVTVTAEERRLTPEQMARRLGVHRSTIVRKILAGEIRADKVGNRHCVPYSEFQRYREDMLDRIARASAPDVEAELFGDQ